LSETYLNKLNIRFESGLIPDVAEFLSENWAMALYHDWFADFSMKLKSVVRENITEILEHVKGLIDNKEELTREQVDKLKALVPTEVKRLIHEQTLEYIRANQNHLPMYYIPGVEFE